jgi:GT2 family glycosyltransferase
MPDSLPPATVVVVNYNTADQLPGCLDALRALEYPGEVEIIVVDNASTDGSADVVRAQFPRVRLIAGAANRGFGGGANLGWQAGQGDLLAVLNPDVRPRPAWLAALARGLADHAAERGAIAGGKLLYADGTVQHAGGTFGFPFATTDHRGRGTPDSGTLDGDAPVPFVTGGALVITRDAAESLGYFDPGFFMYFEDVDLCWRARAAGYTVWYIPAAVATHQESASLERGGALYYEYFQRSRLRFVLKHYGLADLLWGFAPAEAARLRGTLPPLDRAASTTLYADPAALAGVLHSLGGPDGAAPADLTPDAGPPDPGPLARRETLERAVAEVLALWRLNEPADAAARASRPAWGRVRDEWYVPAVRGHQIAFNAAVARAVRDLAAQLSGLDAATLAQSAVDTAALAREIAALRAEVAVLRSQLSAKDKGVTTGSNP